MKTKLYGLLEIQKILLQKANPNWKNPKTKVFLIYKFIEIVVKTLQFEKPIRKSKYKNISIKRSSVIHKVRTKFNQTAYDSGIIPLFYYYSIKESQRSLSNTE